MGVWPQDRDNAFRYTVFPSNILLILQLYLHYMDYFTATLSILCILPPFSRFIGTPLTRNLPARSK